MSETFQEWRLVRVAPATAAGTTAINSDSVDMQDFGACLFFLTVGAIPAGEPATIKAQQSSDDGASDVFADLAGTGQTAADTDDGDTFGINLLRPGERFLRCVVERTGLTGAIVGEIYALLYAKGRRPVSSNITGEATFVTHEDPVEGVA